MIKKFRNIILIAFGIVMMTTPGFAAAQIDIAGNACNGTYAAPGSTCDSGTATTTFNNIVTGIINLFSYVVGAISVIMVIFGGFRYITSAGNDTNMASARNTIIYALIGLVIVVLAQLIVHFVLGKTSAAAGGTGSLFLPH